MHRLLFMIFSLLLFIISDLIIAYKLKSAFSRKYVLYAFISLSFLAYLLIILVFLIGRKNFTYIWLPYYTLTFLIIKYVPQLLVTAFIIVDWILEIFSVFIGSSASFNAGRRSFLVQTGTFISAITGFYFIYGIIRGRNALRTNVIKIPTGLDGLKGFRIAFFSDLHSGTLSQTLMKELATKINSAEVDVVLFGGDWINHFASELEPFVPLLAKINAKYGKFSCWGNHDYSMYYPWDSEEDRLREMNRLREVLRDSGFVVLENEGIIINLDGVRLGIGGVEYWGRALRVKPARIKETFETISNADYKILLTHDPYHFTDYLAHKLDSYPFNLVLSGHTHGFQMGIMINGFRFSPAQFMYKHWAGLYKVKGTYHYVSTGVGSIGYLGRAGVPPELVIIEFV